MKKILKDYFSFNKTERRGIFVLLFLITVLIIFNALLPSILSPPGDDFSTYSREVDAFEKSRVVLESRQKSSHYRREFDFKKPDQSAGLSKLKPFPFNPNEMKPEDWKRMGLTDRQIKSIDNYQSKGGTFRIKNDFKKMYAIHDDEYEILEPFLQLPENYPEKQRNNTYEKKQEEVIIVELNTASSEELQRIKGIGEYFAEKIIKHRRSLGGYCRPEQLLEVPKMDSVRYLQMLPHIEINTVAIRKMDINSITFEELSKHPYFGYNVALSLTNYRTKHGSYKQLTDIKKSALVTEALYQKISPYLKVE